MITLHKAVVRETRRTFMYYGHPLIVTLLPGDVIAIREPRSKREVILDIHCVYIDGLRKIVRSETRTKKTKSRVRLF